MDPLICSRFLLYLPLFVGMVMYVELKFAPETKLNHLSHASRAAARKCNITWYSLPTATTVSTLCMNLLHHSWSNLVDSDIHPTTMTGIACYDRTLEITKG